MAKVQSACIGVCKFNRPGPAGAHCIGCSMTKAQKKIAKKQKKPDAAEAMLALIVAQQQQMGRFDHWRGAYLKRCMKKGRPVPPLIRDREAG